MSFAGAAALLAAGCGQEGPLEAAPGVQREASTGVQAAGGTLAALTGPACSPTGAHVKHQGYDCKVCHSVGGSLCFDASDARVATSTFDFQAKTCTSVQCHTVAPGTYSYYFPGNEMDEEGYPIPELKTVNYGGALAGPTPSWYATNVGCSACHPNPPANGSDGSNAWHSGNHANNQNVGPTPPNACELCHNSPTNVNSPIAQSVNGAGTAILLPTYHGNGAANVNARFRTQCFGCH